MRGGAGTFAASAFGLALAAAVLRGGGSQPDGLVAVSAVALLAVGALAVAVGLGRIAVPAVGREGALLAAFLAALVTWQGVSIAWSIQPDRSWTSFNRGLVYVALLALGMLVGGLVARSARVAAGVLAGVLALAIAWALLGKVVPALGPDNVRNARLQAPVGYANALALLCAMSVPLSLWLATGGAPRRVLRAGAAAALAAALVALALTGSRGGTVVTAVAAVTFLALARDRRGAALALAVAFVPAAVAAVVGLALAGVADAEVARSVRRRDGLIFGAVLVASIGAVASAWFALERSGVRERLQGRGGRAFARTLAAGAALVVCAGVAAVAARGGVGELCNPPDVQVPQAPGTRFGFVSSNNRCTWWADALRIWRDEPVAGTGAGTFELARRPFREDTQQPLAPHDLPLQALSETGLLGLALLLAAAAAAVWTCAAALRRLDGVDRAAAAALVAGVAAWAVHGLVDMGWEYVAVSAPAFAMLGVLAAAGRPPPQGRRRSLTALSVPVVAAVALSSIVLPWLSDRKADDAVAAFVRQDLDTAESDARSAQSLNPLAVRPLFLRASLAVTRRRADEAERLYVDAVRLQPANPETWYELGRFHFRVRRNLEAAYCFLDRAYALDNWDVDTHTLLDEARAAGVGGRPCALFERRSQPS